MPPQLAWAIHGHIGCDERDDDRAYARALVFRSIWTRQHNPSVFRDHFVDIHNQRSGAYAETWFIIQDQHLVVDVERGGLVKSNVPVRDLDVVLTWYDTHVPGVSLDHVCQCSGQHVGVLFSHFLAVRTSSAVLASVLHHSVSVATALFVPPARHGTVSHMLQFCKFLKRQVFDVVAIPPAFGPLIQGIIQLQQ